MSSRRPAVVAHNRDEQCKGMYIAIRSAWAFKGWWSGAIHVTSHHFRSRGGQQRFRWLTNVAGAISYVKHTRHRVCPARSARHPMRVAASRSVI
eukprot:2818953-Prymnesium_polylepis.1